MKRHLTAVAALAALAVFVPAAASTANPPGRSEPLCNGDSGQVVCVIR